MGQTREIPLCHCTEDKFFKKNVILKKSINQNKEKVLVAHCPDCPVILKLKVFVN